VALGADIVATYRDLLDALPDPVVVIDSATRLCWGNRAAEVWSGWALEELIGQPVGGLVHPDDVVTALVSLESVKDKRVGTAIEVRFRDRADEYHRFEVRGAGVPGRPDEVVLALRDMTDRRRWEVAAGDDALLQAIVDHAPGITMLLDAEGRLRGASRALSSLLGRSLEQSLGRHVAELATPEDAAHVRTELALTAAASGSRAFEASFPHLDGRRTVPLGLTGVNLLDDRAVRGLVVTAVDITALVEVRTRLEHLASHDALTALPNRALLLDRLEHALAVAQRRGSTVGVLFCDLDDFKIVNDSYGHRAGDWVLLEVSRRLSAVVRSSDTVARLAGDEFVVVVEDVEEGGLDELATRAERRVAAPIPLPDGGTVSLAMSTGAAASSPSCSVDELLERADSAMYAAKRLRR